MSIRSIEIPNSVTILEGQIIENCDSIEAFYGKFATTDNKSLVYDNIILNYAINNQDDTYKVPDGIVSIGESAFANAKKLKSVYLPNSVINIENNAFIRCHKLTNIEINKNIVSIGDYAFAYCFNLPSFELSDKITSIGSAAFLQCENLTTFYIPKSVKYIGEQAFEYCKSLKEIYCYPTEPPTIYPKYSTNYGYSLGWINPTIYVPKESLNDYMYSDFGYGYTIKEM